MSEQEVITVKEHKRVVAEEALKMLQHGKRVEESANPLKAQYFEDRQAVVENFKDVNAELNEVNKAFNILVKDIDANTNGANKINQKVFALIKQLEARIKKLEVFVDEIVKPSHREPQIAPKVEEHFQKPSNSKLRELRNEDDETRELVLQMEHNAHARRKR